MLPLLLAALASPAPIALTATVTLHPETHRYETRGTWVALNGSGVPADRWQHFADVAWPRWETRGVLDRLVDALPGRAADSEDDAALAFALLYQALLRGHPRARAFGRQLEPIPWEEKKRADVFRLARLARLQYGWELLKAERLREARQVADAAVEDAPSDGQALFFEARVAWMERDDPNVGIEHIEAALEHADDALGRARLLNLHGAALDALGRPAEALPKFHEALKVNESTTNTDTGKAMDEKMSGSLLSNIAEAHWKLGQRDDARSFAEKAALRGGTTDIVKQILAETKKP